MRDPNHPKSIYQLFKQAVYYHYAVLREIWLLIVLIVAAKDCYVIFGGLPEDTAARYLLGFILSALIFILSAASLYATDKILKGSSTTTWQVLRVIFERLAQVLFCCLCYFVAIVAIYFLAKLIVFLMVLWLGSQPWIHGLLFVLLVGLPLTYFMTLTFFTLVMVIVEEKPVLAAFLESMRLSFRHWFRAFGLYFFLIAVIILISPNTIHWHFLSKYYIVILFDFLVLAVFLPLFNIMVLLELSQLRKSAK